MIEKTPNRLQEPAPEALKTTVLVIEQDSSVLNLLRTVLRMNGFAVECFDDPSAALAHFHRCDVDVVVVDLARGGSGGTPLLAQLGRCGAEALARTVITTGLAPAELSAGDCDAAFALLRKPYDIEELVATVSRCASRSTSRHARQRRSTSDAAESRGLRR